MELEVTPVPHKILVEKPGYAPVHLETSGPSRGDKLMVFVLPEPVTDSPKETDRLP
jgi:hypothetical protein